MCSNGIADFSIEHGDGNKRYVIISGTISVPPDSMTTPPSEQALMVSIVVPKLEENVRVKARMTHSMTLLTAIAYSKPLSVQTVNDQRESTEKEAVNVRA